MLVPQYKAGFKNSGYAELSITRVMIIVAPNRGSRSNYNYVSVGGLGICRLACKFQNLKPAPETGNRTPPVETACSSPFGGGISVELDTPGGRYFGERFRQLPVAIDSIRQLPKFSET